jgi:hypothetical protein
MMEESPASIDALLEPLLLLNEVKEVPYTAEYFFYRAAN